jgi:phospholipid/cholesterol/gamma-HCH transport system permease protein
METEPVHTNPPAAAPLATPMGEGWTLGAHGTSAVIVLSGDWRASAWVMQPDAPRDILATGATALAFDSAALGVWDSALVAFLAALRDAAQDHAVGFDPAGLPAPTRQLLSLVVREAAAPAPPSVPFVARVGVAAVAAWREAGQVIVLLGNTVLRSGAALAGRAMMRGTDLLACMRDAGAAALPIVTVINLLVGGILAFVGAVQLRRFGADIYVASLVGIAVVREMAALMTAIIMAGRTGGAYAANLATMQGNEEIDALRAVGIPVFDYLILPRVLALTTMMPILYLWGCAVGICGGFVVAIATLNLSAISFIDETRLSVSGTQFALGLSKSLAFGALIAIAACRVGLRAGRSAADVGSAATTAVVVGVIGVITLDAMFDVCANVLGL